jgi:hypothetical protein
MVGGSEKAEIHRSAGQLPIPSLPTLQCRQFPLTFNYLNGSAQADIRQ